MHRSIALLLGALVACVALADAPAKPEDEWWKRAPKPKPPKESEGSLTYWIGAFGGMQRWNGLEDFDPTDAEAAQGWTGSYDTTSPIYGLLGGIRLGMIKTTSLGIEFSLDRFENATDERVSHDEFAYHADARHTRLGVGGRALFLDGRRVQPTVAIGLAVSFANTDVEPTQDVNFFFGDPEYGSTGFDFGASGGVEIALAKDPHGGPRLRLDLGVEHRSDSDSFESRSGALATKATLGFVYRSRPPTP